ncbi:testis-specific Y-encoded-like protein 2 [Rhynchocyon petersi]
MDRPDEEPPAKSRRLSSPELPRDSLPPPLLRLPLPPPQQRPRLQEETEAAQVLADMRGGKLGPPLPPPPPYVILEEGGIRAYFTLGAGDPIWEPAIESGYRVVPPPTGSLETLTISEASGGSLGIGFQVTRPSSLAEEKARETCSIEGWRSQRLTGPKRKEEVSIIVEEEDETEKESEKKRRKRRKQRKMKKETKERNAQRMEYILQALENIQLDLEGVNIKAGKAFLRLKHKFIQMRRPFLERRDLIIQHIPGFWVNAFLNHPKISILINQRDEDIFRYLTNLQVQDLRHVSMGYKMKLYFQTNPYFTNVVIVKEFQHNHSGLLVSHSTPIRWHRGQEPQAHRHRNQNTSHSFFNWFSSHSLPEADRIAEIIKNDLWVNPLRYYLMGKEGYRANRKKQEKESPKLFHSDTKDECEVMIWENSDGYQAVKHITSETSDSDATTDNETIFDAKISDLMETTDYFETSDNERTNIVESLYDSERPDNENIANNESSDDKTTDNNENTNKSASYNSETLMYSSDYNRDNKKNSDDSENPDGNEGPGNNDEDADDNKNKNCSTGDKSPKGGNQSNNSNNQGNSDNGNERAVECSEDEDTDGNEGDSEGSDDEDNDGSEGDNEGSDDGNEGDNEGSDDDDEDIEVYKNDVEDTGKDQDNSNNQNEDVVEDVSEESEKEEKVNTEGELDPFSPLLSKKNAA